MRKLDQDHVPRLDKKRAGNGRHAIVAGLRVVRPRAQAIENDYALSTANLRDFEGLPGLQADFA